MSTGAMNVSIKNNLNLLSKRDKLRNRLGGYKPNSKTEYNLPKATTKQLKDLSNRLKEEHKIRMLKVIMLSAILFLLLVGIFLYTTEGIIELITINP
ncbi:hypothetical protein [Winogradskyella endarachnes]|uniref:Uncharacterized protein n=1 Tax=Winogradskyella endarachnes TaxID=2681965 RepID=A0A6L6U8R9_9FLAO|nr:hypothetical protein [Winogradskyella endarachnes]MUU77906.1 hypothetical protein [Winogradskyella endarachnes]